MALSNQTQDNVKRWIEIYARIGYAAKGIIYGTVGLLALMESFDFTSGETVGSEGVLQRVARQPFGRVMLFSLAISLIGYVVWRFVQAALDPEHSNSSDKTDLLRRFSYACSGVAYVGVAYSAVEILQVSASGGEDKTAQDWALDMMRQPLGRWLVGGVGLVVFGIGCYYFYRAIKAEFRKRLKRHHMSDAAKTWSMVVGRAGIAARGFVYVVIGCYTMRAAWEFDPSMIKTTEDALAVFNDNPTDELILAVLGIGFIAYGIHMGFQAAYRRIEPI